MGDVGSSNFPGYPLPVTSQAHTVYDYEMPMYVPIQYRARITSSDGDLLMSSDWSNISIATVNSSSTTWHLIDPVDPTRNILDLDIMGDSFSQEKEEEQAVYRPLSRSNAIVTSGVIRGEKFNLNLEFTTKDKWKAFELIRSGQRPLLFRRNYTADQWYIRLGAQRQLTITNHSPALWRVQIDAIESDAP